ncbi:glycosyltransferase [Bacterioplanes sanyensis]|uniref:Glycosyltransferase n=1 Tax=Bacterioplanes sanyensis TaxID=1249553 RepID=A0A222FES3_9GAMM|nr:glycosyltransferase [Bacterioplanes sanyensis]ASP37508.1 glycosyltransferase [Bacterioplanes sanyensis]
MSLTIALLAPSPVPYTPGGAENLWQGLQQAIKEHTSHSVECLNLPSPERNFSELLSSYRRFSELDLRHFDVVISGKYPAWMIDHPHHVCYMLHKLRGVYDTYSRTGLPTALPELPAVLQPLKTLLSARPERALLADLFSLCELGLDRFPQLFAFPGPLTRAVVHQLDAIAQRPGAIKHYAAISATVAARQQYFPSGEPVSIIHPPISGKQPTPGKHQYVFTASRLDKPKRIDWLIDAYQQVSTDVPFKIAGTGPQTEHLKAATRNDPRIEWLGHVSDAELQAYYSDAMFVPFVPDDEDYGLITLEAMHAAKAVLTTSDAGGVTELVENGVTGNICQPSPSAIATVMQQWLDDPVPVQNMGQAGYQKAQEINWHAAVNQLLARSEVMLSGQRRSHLCRRHIVVTATLPAWPVQGGGQSRLFHLYREVAKHCPVTLVALGDEDSDQWLAPNFRQIVRRYTDTQHRISGGIYNATGAEISDVLAEVTTCANLSFMHTLQRVCSNASLAIVSHPYLHRAIRAVWAGPLVYEAQDVEYDVKSSALQHSENGRRLLRRIARLEKDCLQDSRATLVCAQEDAQRFQQLYQISGAMIEVPNGTDCSAIPFTPLTQRYQTLAALGIKVDVILFMGSRHLPNVEAAHQVIELAKQLPEYEFWLMGSVCDHPDFLSVPSNVRRLGMVSEPMRLQVLATATLALNPMLSGSGTNLKMLDYTAAGLNVISTEFGLRGLKFNDKQDLIIADIGDFLRKIPAFLQLEADKKLALAQSARATTESLYDWEACARPFVQCLTELEAEQGWAQFTG